MGVALQRQQREVLAQAEVDVQALALAVFREVGEAGTRAWRGRR